MTEAAAAPGGTEPTKSLGQALRVLAHFLLVQPLYLASHLVPRDRRLWLLANRWGFGGNARYLAEYIVNADLGIRPTWLARNRKEAAAARAAGLKVVNLNSWRGIVAQLRAGVVVLSFGFGDMSAVALGGSYVVHLYHGIPLKLVGLDIDQWRSMKGPAFVRRLVSRVMHWRVAALRGRVDMVVASGELAKERFVSSFGAPPSRVRVLGTPRFDVIHGGAEYERVAGDDLRAQLSLAEADYVVLWLPTHREVPDSEWIPQLTGAQVDRALGSGKVVMVVKPHPRSDFAAFEQRLPRHPRIRLMKALDVDVNALLRVGDALVSDYSSVTLDYAILDRPIHFFTPDLAAYESGRGLYEPLSAISGGVQHADWDSLLAAVAGAAASSTGEPMTAARRIRDYTRNNDAPGSCARIVAAIAREVRLEIPA